jgi:class 3 adenylate cyclase
VAREAGAMRSLESIALGLLIAVAAAVFALYLREEMRGGPWRTRVVVAAAPSPESFPTVLRFRAADDAAASGLRPGDRLVRAGPRELAGAKPWHAYAAFYAAASTSGTLPLEVEREGARVVLEERLSSAQLARDAVLGLCFALTALIILRRAPRSPTARSFALAALAWAIAQPQFPGGAPAQTYAYFGLRIAAGCLWPPLVILSAVRFPEGAWPEGRRLPRWPWLFAALGLTWSSWWLGVPFPSEWGLRANPALGSLVITAVLVVATRNYALAGPAGRRQMKWVLLGGYLGLLPALLGTLLGAFRPDWTLLWFASQVSVVAIPLSVLIAVTRSNLFDIDRLISGTASYTILLVGVGAAALASLPRAADWASARAGLSPTLVQVTLAAALAFVVVRLEPRLRPLLERIFFAERQAFQEAIDRLVEEVHEVGGAGALAERVGERLDALLRPEFCVVYARGGQVFAPIFARRCPITPHFEEERPLARLLAGRVAAVDLERDRTLLGGLDAADRAALNGLGAAVLLPVVRDHTLLGFVALGRKTSGDVYTTTDLALLGLLGGSISASIRRFDDEELLREARTLQDRLRQYVPASIADQLARGRELEAGERVVSVLFADLRGYTSLAEARSAEEIFGVVNRYTETVTRAVTRHGGTVVEFNGDGMMAVFGAPEPLPDKERRALAAARQIVTDVSTLMGAALAPGEGGLAVGVGLATGSAYVGAIRSVDRNIWSAIGNTTNLAARLQAMTRDLGAPIVIDRATHDAARDEARDFEPRPETTIRGLQAPRDVFVLTRRQAAA